MKILHGDNQLATFAAGLGAILMTASQVPAWSAYSGLLMAAGSFIGGFATHMAGANPTPPKA